MAYARTGKPVFESLVKQARMKIQALQEAQSTGLTDLPSIVNLLKGMTEGYEALLLSTEALGAAALSQQTTGLMGRPLSELKCVANIKPLTSDKSEFRLWNDKFVNAVVQGLGPDWRPFFL